MGLHYRYDSANNIVHTTADGIITIEEIMLYIEDVLKDKNIKSGFIEIIDFEEVADLVVSFNQMSPFTDIWKRYQKKGCIAILMFSPKNLGYGISRMVQSMIGINNYKDQATFEVFRTKEALELRVSEIRKSSL